MNAPFSNVLRGLLLLVLPIVGARAQVTLDLLTQTYVPGGAPAVSPLVNDTFSGAATSGSVSTSYGYASAQASLGRMTLATGSSSSHDTTYGDQLHTDGRAQARWEDTILVTASAPELAGTTGRLRASFTVSGSLDLPDELIESNQTTSLAGASWSLDVNRAVGFGDENTVSGQRWMSSYYDSNIDDYVTELVGNANFQTYELLIPFTFGEAFLFRVTGAADSRADPAGTLPDTSVAGEAQIEITWLGVSEVLDASNQVVGDVIVASTGDWLSTAAVPEPSGAAALAGLAALGVVLTRRRRSST